MAHRKPKIKIKNPCPFAPDVSETRYLEALGKLELSDCHNETRKLLLVYAKARAIRDALQKVARLDELDEKRIWSPSRGNAVVANLRDGLRYLAWSERALWSALELMNLGERAEE